MAADPEPTTEPNGIAAEVQRLVDVAREEGRAEGRREARAATPRRVATLLLRGYANALAESTSRLNLEADDAAVVAAALAGVRDAATELGE